MLPSVLKDTGVTIELKTNYPFENKMHYVIDSNKEFNFTIRIPSFTKNLKVNGQEIELCPYGCARLRMTEIPILNKKY